MDITELFKCKNITASTLQLYKSKLHILNDNKPINNLDFLDNIDNINSKISHLKANTRRSYIIAITSILKCLTLQNKSKKILDLYNTYSKILEEYNNKLKDQTNDNTNVISIDTIKDVFNEVKKNRNDDNQSYQDYLIVSLYYIIPPGRNRDYQMLKNNDKYSDTLSKDYNYYDGFKFYFNNYKTKGTYNQQIIDVPLELQKILDYYINKKNIKNDELILTSVRTNKPLKSNNAITVILNRIFNDKVGSSMLRRSYLSNKYSDTQNQLNNDATAMGTSVNTATHNYIKKK